MGGGSEEWALTQRQGRGWQTTHLQDNDADAHSPNELELRFQVRRYGGLEGGEIDASGLVENVGGNPGALGPGRVAIVRRIWTAVFHYVSQTVVDMFTSRALDVVQVCEEK